MDLTKERVTPGDYGGIGLLQTRTARFAKDGQFIFGMAFSDPYDRYALTWQILPWAEATFRYSTDDQRGVQGLDRGADLKFQLFEETADTPEIAVGFQDLLGTGLFDSEYIVASKRYGDFDFSLGVVWGYSVGSDGLLKNPLGILSERYKTRDVPGGRGGQLRLNTFFSGREIDLFGGVEYHTPLEGLSLKAEYDPNDYKLEPGGPLGQNLPVNVGIHYRPWSWLDLGVAFERGDSVMARLALRADLDADEWIPKIAETPPAPLAVRPGTLTARFPELARAAAAAQARNTQGAAATTVDLDLLASEMQQQGLVYQDLKIEGSTATVHLSVQSLALIETKLKALTPVVVALVPEEVETLRFAVETSDNQRRDFDFGRRQLTLDWLVDALFERLQAQQLEIERLDASEGHTIVRVSAKSPKGELDFLVAARAVRDLLPLPSHTVTVIGRRGGSDDSSLVLNLADGSHVYTPRLVVASAVPAQDGPTALSEEAVQAIAAKIFEALPPQGLTGAAFHLTQRRATIVVIPNSFPEVGRNVGRAARVVASNAPESVEEVSVVIRTGGIDVSSVTLMRRHLEDLALGAGSPEEVLRVAVVERPQTRAQPVATTVRNSGLYPRFSWGLGPQLRPSIGAPEDPFLFQIWARLTGEVELLPGFHLRGVLGKDIYNNFDKIFRGPKGSLEPVRTNLKEYLQKGEDALVSAQADYVFSPAPDWYARAAVGYFEMMFGGFSGEVLYRRQNARWAVGLELSHVFQRDFNQRLGFRNYDTTTGHLSFYYKLPWYGLEATVHTGRYLARDWGATFQLARRFRGGIVVGGFFTLTDASAEEFGEGSFDKGFFFRIPLNMLLPYSSRDSIGTLFRPLTSDGGQMVFVGPKLYPLTEDGQLDVLNRAWHRLMD